MTDKTKPFVVDSIRRPLKVPLGQVIVDDAAHLPAVKIVGILRTGVIPEANKIPGGVGPKGIAWRASSHGSPGDFLSHPSLG